MLASSRISTTYVETIGTVPEPSRSVQIKAARA